jgi:hypothetical protein
MEVCNSRYAKTMLGSARTKFKIPSKKVRQVGVKIEPELYARLTKACEIQQHREGQLARILIEWALPYYERARSVEAFTATEPLVPNGRISRETQEILFAAISAILDRAPSTVIEDLVRKVTHYAGKYAEEK